jgi:hypothetical protein
MKALYAFSLLLFLAVVGLSQVLMTNDDVVAMIGAGLAPEIVNAKIKSSKTEFDTSTAALLKLSQAKVPDSVVVVMVEKQQKEGEKKDAEAGANQNALNSIPELGNLADLAGKKKVFVSSDYLKGRDIIIKELSKDGTFTVVDKVEDSDFVIVYREVTQVRNVVATANSNSDPYGNSTTTTATARTNKEQVGEIRVMMPGAGGSRLRMLYQTTKTAYWVWDDPASKSTTKQFLKDFKKVPVRP